MWLINATSYELEDFSNREIPDYAILSHTWGDGEVTFQDMFSAAKFQKEGFNKIIMTCKEALAQGLSYAWVDTGSINKASSAELSESINSMFEWYRSAAICYVYLADLEAISDLPQCRWPTRGFTLQELIAPKAVKFYDKFWRCIGTKANLASVIEQVTRIPEAILCGRRDIHEMSIATRMSWAAHRRTTRVEDLAYCLLGLFDINMPLLYGEGMKAFRRLQEEIVKRTNDLTIFAWEVPKDHQQQYIGLFAPSPDAFAASSGIEPFSDDHAEFSVTNKGLHLLGDIPLRVGSITREGVSGEIFLIHLGTRTISRDARRGESHDGGIYLHKIGPRLMCRDGGLPLDGFGPETSYVELQDFSDTYIYLDPTTNIQESYSSYRKGTVHVPRLGNDSFALQSARPESLWDCTDRLFLRAKPYDWVMYPPVLIMEFELLGPTFYQFSIIVLCVYEQPGRNPRLVVFSQEDHTRETAIILQQQHREKGLTWDELLLVAPTVGAMKSHTVIELEGIKHRIIASPCLAIMERNSCHFQVWRIQLQCDQVIPERMDIF